MFRIVSPSNGLPYSLPCDPSASFEPGQVGQLKLLGNQVVCGVSDGTAPLGIIDDVRKTSFSAVSVEEVVLSGHIAGVEEDGKWVTPYEVKLELLNPNILSTSFICFTDIDVELNARNGILTFLEGTELNYCLSGTGIPDAIRVVVSYTYQIPNIPGDDSTAASGRITIWFDRIVIETDMFATNRRYPLNAPLYIGLDGKFTSVPVQSGYPSVGFVMAPPTTIHGSLQLIWF